MPFQKLVREHRRALEGGLAQEVNLRRLRPVPQCVLLANIFQPFDCVLQFPWNALSSSAVLPNSRAVRSSKVLRGNASEGELLSMFRRWHLGMYSCGIWDNLSELMNCLVSKMMSSSSSGY